MKRKNRILEEWCKLLQFQYHTNTNWALTALEFLASLRICLAVWTSSASSQPFRTHTCCCTRTHRRSITCAHTRENRFTHLEANTRHPVGCETKHDMLRIVCANIDGVIRGHTCSAVLVTRPWWRRSACFWEKRWVWLFLSRARWICHKRDTDMHTHRKQTRRERG